MIKKENRKIVVVNQAVNYLTIGFANAFKQRFEEVALITGSVHVQGEELDRRIKVTNINQWHESPAWKKAFSYVRALITMSWLLMTKFRKYELFFVSVPPMGYLLNLVLPQRFSMVIWDVYPDIFKITGMKENHLAYRVWGWLNKKSFKRAYRLFTISERMADLLEKYVNRDKIIIQPIWSIFQDEQPIAKEDNIFIKQYNLQDKFIVQYSGNIGLTHNVETMVDLAELLKEEPNILFQIIGRGPRKNHLEKLVKERNLPNCMFLPFQSDEMFPYSLSAADIGVVILDEKTSKGSVPSKSYNLMSYGVPSLYIAAIDSQLKLYADRFQNGKCYSKENLCLAKDFIIALHKDITLYDKVSKNALMAAQNFKRKNADTFIDLYLQK